MSDFVKIPVLKSNKTVTTPVTAVFPYIHEVAKFGDYEINVDMVAEPALRDQLQTEAKALWAKAGEQFGFDAANMKPDNAFMKTGETKTGETFERVCFKMKSTRKQSGKEIAQKPRVVDSSNAPMNDAVYGGSTVRIAYYLQFTEVNGKRYISPKLEAVKVIELVSTGGQTVESLFGDEDEGGFVASTQPEAPAVVEAPAAPAVTPGGDF